MRPDRPPIASALEAEKEQHDAFETPAEVSADEPERQGNRDHRPWPTNVVGEDSQNDELARLRVVVASFGPSVVESRTCQGWRLSAVWRCTNEPEWMLEG